MHLVRTGRPPRLDSLKQTRRPHDSWNAEVPAERTLRLTNWFRVDDRHTKQFWDAPQHVLDEPHGDEPSAYARGDAT